MRVRGACCDQSLPVFDQVEQVVLDVNYLPALTHGRTDLR